MVAKERWSLDRVAKTVGNINCLSNPILAGNGSSHPKELPLYLRNVTCTWDIMLLCLPDDFCTTAFLQKQKRK